MSIALLDVNVLVALFDSAYPTVAGHRQITDIYLLALAVQHSGKLATFDWTIPLNAVRRAAVSHLEILGTRPGP